MGFFSKTLQAAMPKMIGNPITTAVAMVSVALSVVKGKKATKATKNKKKATVKKSKIISKKQKKQMEVMERVCQSAYGVYIRGVTTVAARYIGHPAVAIPASEMVKTMMEEAAPSVNKYCVICTEQKQKVDTNDIVQIAQIYKNTINETKQYLKDKKLYIPTVNDYLLTGYNGTIQSVQYLMDKYCPELGETLDNIKTKKAEMISSFYENNRQIYIKNPEKGSIFDKMLFDVPIDETNMNIFRKAGVTVNGVVSGFLKDVASGANAIVDVALSPLDVAEAMTSPGALTLGTILNGMTEDVVNDWQKGTIQGKTEAIGRVISIISPTEILKAAGVVRKGVKAVGRLGKTANVVDTAVDTTKSLANAADTAVDLTKTLSNLGDMTEDAARGLNGLTSKLKNIKEKFTDDIISQKPKELLEQKPNGIPEQKPKELLEQKPNGTPEQKPKELLEQKPNEMPEQKPNKAPEQKPNETPEQKPNEAPEQKPNGTPEQKPNEVPEQKPNEAPEQKSEELLEQKPNEAPAETVVRGKSDVNGYDSVSISEKKSNFYMDKITGNNKPGKSETIKDSSIISKKETVKPSDDNLKTHPNAAVNSSIHKEGRRTIYTNLSGNEVSWIDQTSKDIESIINSKLNSSKPGDILEGQVAQAVKETGYLEGCGLSIERPNGSKAGDIDVLTDSYIIEVKKSLAAVDKKQFDKLTNPQNVDYFNFDGKGIIYYIEDSTIKNPYNQKTLELLQSCENVTVVHTLDDLKGVILK